MIFPLKYLFNYWQFIKDKEGMQDEREIIVELLLKGEVFMEKQLN